MKDLLHQTYLQEKLVVFYDWRFLHNQNLYFSIYQVKDKIYYSDLIGFKVIYNSSTIGEIKEVQRIANKEYILINSSLIPFIKDVFYKNLNDEERTIELTEQGKDVLDNA